MSLMLGTRPTTQRTVTLYVPVLSLLLRYVTREPNLRVKRSCTGLGNLEVFLFGFIVSKDYDGLCLFIVGLVRRHVTGPHSVHVPRSTGL
jgi:hypothetical protein